MNIIDEIRLLASTFKLLSIFVASLISAFLSVIIYLLQKLLNRRQNVVIVLTFIFSFAIQCIPMLLTIGDTSGGVENQIEETNVPSNTITSPLKVIPQKFLGYYLFDIDNYICDVLNDAIFDIDLYSKDFNIHFTEYSVTQSENGEYVYFFDHVYAGNYLLTLSSEEYLYRQIEVTLLPSERSTDDASPYWLIHPVMEKLNEGNLFPMYIRFFSSDYIPLSDIKYDIIEYPPYRNVQSTYSTTDGEGCLESGFFIIPDSSIEILFINPYSEEECRYNILATYDPIVNFCDIILVVDKSGVIEQTMPSIIWDY